MQKWSKDEFALKRSIGEIVVKECTLLKYTDPRLIDVYLWEIKITERHTNDVIRVFIRGKEYVVNITEGLMLYSQKTDVTDVEEEEFEFNDLVGAT